MVAPARFKALALALEGASEVPHVDRLAYRTPRKIFATLAPDGRSANLLLSPEVQDAIVEAMPQHFRPVAGGWGRMGYTTVELAGVPEVELVRALAEAHAMARPKPSARPKARTAQPRPVRKSSSVVKARRK
jgi:hypothetical protein